MKLYCVLIFILIQESLNLSKTRHSFPFICACLYFPVCIISNSNTNYMHISLFNS